MLEHRGQHRPFSSHIGVDRSVFSLALTDRLESLVWLSCVCTLPNQCEDKSKVLDFWMKNERVAPPFLEVLRNQSDVKGMGDNSRRIFLLILSIHVNNPTTRA